VFSRSWSCALSTQYLVLSVGLVGFFGCAQAVRHSDTPPGSSIQLIRGDAKKLEELVAAHQGKVVLVDYWATWCLPCVESFPHTVELAKKYKEQGLATIAVNFDLLEDEPKVREFLAKQGADFENMISQHDAIGQKPAEDFDFDAVPVYRLYDRQGKLSQKWEGTAPGEELTKKIEALLAEK